jgi:hypothetical protein
MKNTKLLLKVLIVVLGVGFIVLSAAIALYPQKNKRETVTETPEIQALPPLQGQTKLYRSDKYGFEFYYPENYEFIEERTSQGVTFLDFGFRNPPSEETPTSYLTITLNSNLDHKSLEECNEKSMNTCLASKGFGQEDNVESVMLGNRKAVTFYTGGGVDNAYHIVQTVDKPEVELQMFVAGGGLNRAFQGIIDSFKFTSF